MKSIAQTFNKTTVSLVAFFMLTSCGGSAPQGDEGPSYSGTLTESPIGRIFVAAKDEQAQQALSASTLKAASGHDEDGDETIEKILITVREIQLKRSESDVAPEDTIPIGPRDQVFDLFDLVGRFAELVIGDSFVPVGEYHQIRLILSEDNTIVVDGEEHPLKIPSGQQTGIKLDGTFTLHGGTVTSVLLDFDVNSSIIRNRGQGYILTPVIRIISVEEEVDSTALTEQPLSEVYTAVVNGVTIAYEIRGEYLVTEGDIIIGTVAEGIDENLVAHMRAARVGRSIRISGDQHLWPEGKVPYSIDPQISGYRRDAVIAAITEWQGTEPRIDLDFIPRTGQGDYIYFRLGTYGTGCYSYVGRIGGGQVINLQPGCFDKYTIAHEIAHALGMWHEQSREDRNSYVTIHFENIFTESQYNFRQHIHNGDDLGSYDYDSVMHYSRYAFSTNGLETITPIQPLPPGVYLGQRTHLSAGDISGMIEMYGLSDFLQTKVTLGETSFYGPALAHGDGHIFMAWTGIAAFGEFNYLNVLTSDDGVNFFNKVTLSDTSVAGPSLAYFNNKLYMAWAGIDFEHKLNVMSSTDGVNWGNKVTLGETSTHDPMLCACNGALYLAWTGTDFSQKLNVMSSADGANWGNKATLTDTSSSGPTLACGGGTLFLGWIGTDLLRHLNVMSSADGINWSGKITLDEIGNDIALASGDDGYLYLSWTGIGNFRINLLRSADGQNFDTKMTMADTSADRPSLLWANDKLHLGWTGINFADWALNIGGYLNIRQ